VSNNTFSSLPPSQVPFFTVTITDFALSGSVASTSIPGAPAIYTIGLTSTSQGAFTYPVSLSCGAGLPAGATCQFSPISVTPSATTAITANSTSTLTIYTTNVSSMTSKPFELTEAWILVGLVSPFLLIMFAFHGKRPRVALESLVFISGLAFVTLIVVASCGSHQTSPSPTKYTVTITGTANQLAHTTTVSFTQ
jgi:hypothetical protein